MWPLSRWRSPGHKSLLPGATASWSFKDVVAHPHGWRIVTLARRGAACNHCTPAAPPWPAHLGHNSEEDLDTINEWIYQAYRDRSLGECRQSFQRMGDTAAALSEQELNEATARLRATHDLAWGAVKMPRS